MSFSPRYSGLPHIVDFLRPGFDKKAPCKGGDRNYKSIPGYGICGIEIDEWNMVDAIITPAHTVMEFGARFGTTSCRLAHATGNSGNVVSVEPDKEAHPYLLRSRDLNRCNFHAVLGIVALKEQYLIRGVNGYDHKTVNAEELDPRNTKHAGLARIPSITPREIERKIGSRVNALLIDCEGCISRVFETGLVKQVDLVMIEHDMFMVPPTNIHYGNYSRQLRGMGFVRIWLAHDTFAPSEPWSGGMVHSAWARKGSTYGDAEKNMCFEYKKKKKLSDEWLKCATDDKGLESLPNGGRRA